MQEGKVPGQKKKWQALFHNIDNGLTSQGKRKRSAGPSVDWPVRWLVGRSADQLVGRSADWLAGRSTVLPIGGLAGRPSGRPVGRLAGEEG